MHIAHHPVPSRPIEAVIAARRRDEAALAARCRAFAAIAEALAHYGRDRGPTLTGADRRGRWERLGAYAAAAASVDVVTLREAAEKLRRAPGGDEPHGPDGARARSRQVGPASRPAGPRL